ncbi:hypothetical protein BdWA1_001681 [Babesia duncani]|uniref:Uncharacterized protein n=1 Tax=Babesia duncani TaxID=323732 RepID=A0AAD9UP67_9APIC|nr:hypothetical protein BdWA1_001681 [Babesia duncani]
MATSHAINRILSSCLKNPHSKQYGWTHLDSLFYSARNRENRNILDRIDSPRMIINIARRGLKLQVFDSTLWNDLSHKALEMQQSFKASQWVELLHVFKRIKIRDGKLYYTAMQQIENNIHELSLQQLSILALCFAYFDFCPSALFNKIALIVCEDFLKHKFHPNQEQLKALTKISSYAHLVGAFAKCSFGNKQLFNTVALDIVDLFAQNKGLIPSNLLLKIVISYVSLGYRHVPLFDVLCKEMVTAKLSRDELTTIKSQFDVIDYENDLMNNVFAYRLGNS